MLERELKIIALHSIHDGVYNYRHSWAKYILQEENRGILSRVGTYIQRVTNTLMRNDDFCVIYPPNDNIDT